MNCYIMEDEAPVIYGLEFQVYSLSLSLSVCVCVCVCVCV